MRPFRTLTSSATQRVTIISRTVPRTQYESACPAERKPSEVRVSIHNVNTYSEKSGTGQVRIFSAFRPEGPRYISQGQSPWFRPMKEKAPKERAKVSTLLRSFFIRRPVSRASATLQPWLSQHGPSGLYLCHKWFHGKQCRGDWCAFLSKTKKDHIDLFDRRATKPLGSELCRRAERKKIKREGTLISRRALRYPLNGQVGGREDLDARFIKGVSYVLVQHTFNVREP